MFGYAGKIARINLSSGIVEDYPVSDKDRKMFLGGKTLAAKIIYDSLQSKVEAFSEENIIVITTSAGSTALAAKGLNSSKVVLAGSLTNFCRWSEILANNSSLSNLAACSGVLGGCSNAFHTF